MNNFVRVVIAIAIAFGISAGVRYAVKAVQTERAVAKLSNPTEQVVTVAETKTEFIAGCMEVDLSTTEFSQRQYCECLINDLLVDMTPNDVVKLGLSNEAEASRVLTPYANKCLAQQGF